MKKYFLLSALIGMAVVLASFFQNGIDAPAQSSVSSPVAASKEDTPPSTITDPIGEMLRKMSLEEKIGQMFMIGFFTSDMQKWKGEFLDQFNIGGVILHPYNVENPEQLKTLTDELQSGVKKGNPPLFISVNQEIGGDVLGGEVLTVKFAKETRGGRQIADEAIAFEVGKVRAQELKELGININLAPVLDVVEEKNSFLHDRSFSSDEKRVALLGNAYIEGQREGGIISCAKHFPGHGVALGDSHLNIPISSASLDDLQKHLIPFRSAIENKVEMIMVTHMSFPRIDKDNIVPFSPFFITDLLRKEFSFGGVIITDDLEMKAIRNVASVPEAVILAVKAGVDIITISSTPEIQKAGYASLLEAVRKGEITEERIDKSVERILRLKLQVFGSTSVGDN